MSLWRHLTRGLGVLTRRRRADSDLDDELRHYVEEAIDADIARGVPPAAARRQALADVGSPIRVRERVRDAGWEVWIASWLTDVRLAGRTLAKTPIFTAVVVLVVAHRQRRGGHRLQRPERDRAAARARRRRSCVARRLATGARRR